MHKRLHKVLSLAMAALLFVTSTFANVNQAYAAESVQTGDVYETTYAIAELGTPGGYQYTSETTDEGTSFTYSAQYAEVKFAIPEDVVKAGLKGYRVSVSSTENLGLKIYSAAGQAAVSYWADSVFLDDAVVPTEIGLMNCAEEEKTFTFSSVTFVTERELGVEAPVTDPEDPETPVVEPEEPETPAEQPNVSAAQAVAPISKPTPAAQKTTAATPAEKTTVAATSTSTPVAEAVAAAAEEAPAADAE